MHATFRKLKILLKYVVKLFQFNISKNQQKRKKMFVFQIENLVKNSVRLRIKKQGNKAPKMILRYGWPS